jgi:hypothetical protein
MLLIFLMIFTIVGSGCKRTAPPPWREMHFPVSKGEVLPGSDENHLIVEYKGIAEQTVLFREFRQALERNGYTFERDGKEHDPPGNAFSAIFKKGAEVVKLTVDGSKNTSVRVRKL